MQTFTLELFLFRKMLTTKRMVFLQWSQDRAFGVRTQPLSLPMTRWTKRNHANKQKYETLHFDVFSSPNLAFGRMHLCLWSDVAQSSSLFHPF